MKSISTWISVLLFAVLFQQKSQAQCPISNACTPGNATNAQAIVFGGGIYEVTLGTFNHVSAGAVEGYVDKCNLGTTDITLGSPLAITVRTGTLISENVRVYIDLNNDLSFNPTTELVYSSNNAKVHSGFINLTSGTQNQILKMRVTADLITAAVVPGPCTTPEYSQVEDYAVRIIANTVPPIARFTVSDTLTCTGNVTFTDQSINNPTSWAWNFGDNQTSTSQNPTHTYATPGKYTVKLKVTSVNGVDSLTKVNLVHYNDTVPAAASCAPITQNQCCGYGITRVKINTIDNFSTVGSYENFTCSQRTVLLQGKAYPFSITTNPNQAQDTKVWIDYNNNGQFEANELIWTQLNAINPTTQLVIPGDTAIKKNIPLRMRIVSEYAGANFNACIPLDKGQCEDYTVVILPNLLAPVASFTVSSPDFCLPTFDFSSTSENVVTSYHWFFGDGTDSISDQPTISHTYAGAGSYNVKLIVTGPYGVDSVEVIKAATYFGAPATACALVTQVIPQPIQVGIARVQFGTIDKSSGLYTEGYQDFSCTNQTTARAGTAVRLKVKNSSGTNEKVRVWIDWDASGSFEAGELVLSNGPDTAHVAQVTIPTTAIFNQPLRMRVASNINQAGAINACGTIQAGQAEDYSVVVFPNNVPPTTAFTADKTESCTGIVQFNDQSENAPNFYLWDFGDGNTSNLPSPIHSYAATGIYTIKLKTGNDYGFDSLTRPNYITVTQITGMVPANCIPANSNTCCEYGISRVTFAGIDRQSGPASEGNMDFTCGTIGQATIGTSTPITIQNSGTNVERVGVWIDWDNNGVFATNELVYTSTGTTNHLGNINIPGNAPINVGLRMRVRSDLANAPLAGACAALQFGQTEDYQFKVVGNDNPPIALFTADKTTTCFNTVLFADTSFNAPTSWKWYFGDGDSSTLRNPSHVYPGPGTYDVTLIASNANGSDTLVKIGYIHITEGQNLKAAPCAPPTANTGATNPGAGIIQVLLGSINKSSGLAAVESYQDFACSDRTNLVFGQNYTLNVRTNQTINETCRAWIDWNNDGIFSDPAERVLNSMNTRNHSAAIIIPANARKDTALRMRVMSDVAAGPGGNLQPCGTPNFGQIEDYAVIVVNNTQPPLAHLFARNTTSCSGYVQFGDSSQNVPSTWYWEFGDGQVSSLQNPLHQYVATGVYSIKLKVSNEFGVDSTTRLNYVTVSGLYGPKPSNCTSSSVNLGPFGINRVRIANLDKTTGFAVADGGYLDYSCSDSAFVAITDAGQNVVLTVNTSNAQNCRVYIDFDNNGQFDASDLALSSNNNNVHSVNLTLAQNQCLGVPVRMRVISDNRVNNITGPCYNPLQGQVEDYMVRLVWAVSNQGRLSDSSFEVYPNPSEGQFRVILPSAVQAKTWSIFDLRGKLVASGLVTGEKEQTISKSDLPSGLFVIRLEGANGTVQRRINIQK